MIGVFSLVFDPGGIQMTYWEKGFNADRPIDTYRRISHRCNRIRE